MSLDVTKLEKARSRGNKTVARCPACAENKADQKGEHLIVNANGSFGCVLYPGASPESKAHRRRIFALCGIKELESLIVREKSAPYTHGLVLNVPTVPNGTHGTAENKTVVYGAARKGLLRVILETFGHDFMSNKPNNHEGSGTPEAPTELIQITRHENCVLARWRCTLCGGLTDKQDYLYELPGDHNAIVCDQCALHPEGIPERIREYVQSLREYAKHADCLEEWAKLRYVTDHRLREQRGYQLIPDFSAGLTRWERAAHKEGQ
jgi:hypothetical protein